MTGQDTPKLEVIKITGDTLDDFVGLKLRDNEAALIAPVPEWLAEAAYEPCALTFGLGQAGKAVGLISVVDPRLIAQDEQDDFQSGCLYVWRVMVDSAARGQGIGRAALAFAEGYARLIGLKGVSLTTADKKPGNALIFYEGLGFQPTGRRLHDEIELIRRFDP
ncbi:GNAT family N-acetyltransferase [Primorskyibacter sp. S187A]|uniref:GNAT family N-acetyltransferase n=1 Tax=Primorskyibacter sp. S187A TaxID=3415130 RepID=UPI003C7A4D57